MSNQSPEEILARTMSVFGWLLGAAFIIIGIGWLLIPTSIWSSAINGISFFVMALLVLPPARKYAYEKTGKTLSTAKRALALFTLFLLPQLLVGQINSFLAERNVQAITDLIEQGENQAALDRINQLQPDSNDERLNLLKYRANHSLTKQACEKKSLTELRLLSEKKDINGMRNLEKECGRFLPNLTLSINQEIKTYQDKIKSTISLLLKEGDSFTENEFDALMKQLPPETSQKPTGTYWVPLDNEYVRIKTSRFKVNTYWEIGIESISHLATIEDEISQPIQPASNDKDSFCRTYLLVSSDDVLARRGKPMETKKTGNDSNGMVVEWKYYDCIFVMQRRELNGFEAYRVADARHNPENLNKSEINPGPPAYYDSTSIATDPVDCANFKKFVEAKGHGFFETAMIVKEAEKQGTCKW